MTTTDMGKIHVAAKSTPRPSKMRTLFALQFKEMFRNYSLFFFVAFFPFMMMGMFIGMSKLMGNSTTMDFSSTGILLALFMGTGGVAMTSTAGPLAEYRERGTLRVLSTTPLSRSAFIFTHLVTRVLVAFILGQIVLCIALMMKLVSWSAFIRLVPTIVVGLIVYMGIGYLIGGLVKTGQLATNIATLGQVFFMLMSGIAIPLALLPENLRTVLAWLPTSQFGDLLLWSVSSPLQHHAWWMSALYSIGFGSVLILITVKLFRWDTKD